LAERAGTVDVRPLGPAFIIEVSLGDLEQEISPIVVVFRFRWLERLKKWQYRLEFSDGTPLAPACLVQAGARVPISETMGSAPEGYLQWVGPDNYAQEDLGSNLRLIYYPTPRPQEGGFLIPTS